MRRVLLAQTSFLGDVVLTTALERALRAALPDAEIWWLVRPDARPLVEPLAGRDRVLAFDKRGADAGVLGVWRTAARLRRLRFDAALAVQRSLRTAALLALARIPRRIGFAGAPGAILYTERVERAGAHARDRLLALAVPWICAHGGALPEPYLVIAPEDESAAAALLAAADVRTHDRLLVLAPGSAWPTKRWPPELFGEAAVQLVPRHFDRAIVVGGAGDRPLADVIGARLAAGRSERANLASSICVDLTGRTSVGEMVAVLGRAALVIANDSAPAHVAAALGRPVIAAFGPTVPAQGFAPLGAQVRIVERALSCRPCSRHGGLVCPIGTHECLRDLAPEVVVRAATELIGPRDERIDAAALPAQAVSRGHDRT